MVKIPVVLIRQVAWSKIASRAEEEPSSTLGFGQVPGSIHASMHPLLALFFADIPFGHQPLGKLFCRGSGNAF